VDLLPERGTAIDLCTGSGAIAKVLSTARPRARVVASDIDPRAVACARHLRPTAVWPVRVREDAFGPGLPQADLWLSPDHAVFVENVLIPIRHLINGTTIAQEKRGTVRYFHLELQRHDVLLAEGLPCESFLDTGDKAAFDDGAAARRMRPEHAIRVWDAMGCAPLVVQGAMLDTVRERLARSAAPPMPIPLADPPPVRKMHQSWTCYAP